MPLFLVQHGKSQTKEVDPERGLTEEGAAEVRGVARVAKECGLRLSKVRHSGKKRARETAEILAEALLDSEGSVAAIEGLGPLDDVSEIAARVSEEARLMLVGHLPFMERLTSFLITGDAEKPVLKFQNGGIVCLDREPDSGAWVVKWAFVASLCGFA